MTGISRETANRPSGRLIVGLVFAGAALVITDHVSEQGDRDTPATVGVLVGAAACIALGRRSILAAVFCGLITLDFFVAPLLSRIGSDGGRPPPEIAYTPETAYIWLLAVAAGALLGARRPRSTVPPDNSTNGPLRWFALAVVGLMCAQAYLLYAGILGYSAQINSGLSAPAGMLGSLSAVAPFGVLAVCAMWQPGSIRRSALGALVVGEMALLMATGFRGAAPVLVAAFVVVVVVTHAERLRPMGRGKLAAIAVGLAIAAIGTFTAAAVLKDAALMSTPGRTDVHFLWTADEFLPQLGQRLDLGPPFQMSLAYSGAGEEPGVLSWSNQSAALFPRVFWPDKPIVDYPQLVTSEIYGLRDVQSSSTISTLGDVNLNSGPYGTLIIGILIGIGLNLIEQHIRSGHSRPIGYIAFAIILPVLFNEEVPLGLMLADLLQPLIVLFLLWRVAVIVSAHSSRQGASQTGPSNLEQGALT